MNQNTNPHEYYKNQIKKLEVQEKNLSRISRIISISRLLTFLSIPVFLGIFFQDSSNYFYLLFSILSLLTFLYMLKKHQQISQEQKRIIRLLNLSQMEIKILHHAYSDRPEGKEYMAPDHAYASDLDILGPASLYQYINRTVTEIGGAMLAKWFQEPHFSAEVIDERQNICREMAHHPDWLLQFSADAYHDEIRDTKQFTQWIHHPSLFSNHSKWLTGIRGIRILTVLLCSFSMAGFIYSGWVISLILLNLTIITVFFRRIQSIYQSSEKVYPILYSYSSLLSRMEKAPFTSPWFQSKLQTISKNSSSASGKIHQLSNLLSRFDARNNILVGFFRNALFLTDLEIVLKLELWKEKYGIETTGWFQTIAETDAMKSLALFSFNHPSYPFPQIIQERFSYEAHQLGHPLIPPAERIGNNFFMNDWQQFIILTGANMAGKSTFLRTLGVNYVLACLGAPVCASAMKISPVRLITSIRANDSLVKHESYFYAELKKLQTIVNLLEKGEPLFILLDEVLKGTNSLDKLNGSIALVKKFLHLPTSGIIATHDIALGELEKEFPGKVYNYCFEADVSNDQLHFDYTLRKGMAQQMTALYLMKKMEII